MFDSKSSSGALISFPKIHFLSLSCLLALAACSSTAPNKNNIQPQAVLADLASDKVQSITPIIQPGAPGQDARTLSAKDAVLIADTSYTPDDVMFMQNMIPHHSQAVDMAILVAQRTNNPAIIDIAGRIGRSQADEIAFMRDWLVQRDENPDLDHSMHMDHSEMGMASSAQMQSLADAKGTEFDRIFLNLMIPHHEGAVKMVQDLLAQPGSAYDPILYDFVSDIVNDQQAEITQMDYLLSTLSTDPRVGLKAGFADAEIASSNLRLLASLPRPNGFFDPQNPSNLPPVKMTNAQQQTQQRSTESDGDAKTEWGERWPLLSFWNTDMAFSKNILVAGNYHGYNIYQLNDLGKPKLASSIVCPGGQGDVSIVGNLLIMSVEQTRARIDCGLQGINEDVSDERFRGLRIFDISDITMPKQVGLVQTCRGSHTHSIVSADDERIVVYNSGTAGVRDEDELAGCIGDIAGDNRTALFRIDVIEIPINNPEEAKITSSPAVFADQSGRLAGLWRGGDHGEGTQYSSITDQCHDITVFPELNIAAGACSGNGIILDISNPLEPVRIDAVSDTGFAYWHSATFNNDGTKVIFTDEWGGGTQARCRASDPKTWGANAIYSFNDGKLAFESYYKIDAPQSEQENCVAHNGSVIPVPGRDIFVQAWYQGGLSVIDFTDTTQPKEIAYFDRGPIHKERMVVGGYWSSYWYNGKIYGSEILRGLDVMELQESEFITANEIAAAKLADMGDTFNPQQQFSITWPDEPVVALAYIDQFERNDTFDKAILSQVRHVIEQSQLALKSGVNSETGNREIAEKLKKVAILFENKGDAHSRATKLRDVLVALSKRFS